jgi:hypothetical protein
MNYEVDTTTTRLTTEVIHCIALALLDKAEELERFQRMKDETAPSGRPLSPTTTPSTSKTHQANRNRETSPAHPGRTRRTY